MPHSSHPEFSHDLLQRLAKLLARQSSDVVAFLLGCILHILRKDRVEHPEGETDNAGRWYPRGHDAEVFQSDLYRSPSRAWPWSYMLACRSLDHCLNFYHVEERGTARKVVIAMRKGDWARVEKLSHCPEFRHLLHAAQRDIIVQQFSETLKGYRDNQEATLLALCCRWILGECSEKRFSDLLTAKGLASDACRSRKILCALRSGDITKAISYCPAFALEALA